MVMEDSMLWPFFAVSTCIKLLLIPAYHSTDFEVHRNWLALTHSLPLKEWYYEATSEWTLDYPPFFAYFEWLLSQVARFVDPKMLLVDNLNYASGETKYFQRISVMIMDLIFLWGVQKCLKALRGMGFKILLRSSEVFLVFNIGLIFVDHVHFQYNGFLFGILLLSIGYLLEEHYLKSAFLFACLLNFKHIFLYTAPAFAVYLLKFYCLDANKNFIVSFLKLLGVGLTPFVLSFGPFYEHLPQVLSRLFPFKRGLTHAYWAPNFWALYNTVDKVTSTLLKVRPLASPTSGLVQEFDHAVLPSVRPLATFVLTVLTMLPMLVRLWMYTSKRESKVAFIRSVVICSTCSFMFGWHVHEKAILMSLIPMCLLFFINHIDAKYAFILSAVGYFSLFPLLFHIDLFIIRYSLYLAYMGFMYKQFVCYYKHNPSMNILEDLYIYGLLILPLYEHVISPWTGFNKKLPFMPLLLYSMYCGIGVFYCFIRYYIHALDIRTLTTTTTTTTIKSKSKVFKQTKLKDNRDNIKSAAKVMKNVKEKLK